MTSFTTEVSNGTSKLEVTFTTHFLLVNLWSHVSLHDEVFFSCEVKQRDLGQKVFSSCDKLLLALNLTSCLPRVCFIYILVSCRFDVQRLLLFIEQQTTTSYTPSCCSSPRKLIEALADPIVSLRLFYCLLEGHVKVILSFKAHFFLSPSTRLVRVAQEGMSSFQFICDAVAAEEKVQGRETHILLSTVSVLLNMPFCGVLRSSTGDPGLGMSCRAGWPLIHRPLTLFSKVEMK